MVFPIVNDGPPPVHTPPKNVFYVHILQSEASGRYYAGSTDDLTRRLAEPNAGKTPSTHNRGPWRIVHTEELGSHQDARRREAQIKGWKSRKFMEQTLGLCDSGR